MANIKEIISGWFNKKFITTWIVVSVLAIITAEIIGLRSGESFKITVMLLRILLGFILYPISLLFRIIVKLTPGGPGKYPIVDKIVYFVLPFVITTVLTLTLPNS